MNRERPETPPSDLTDGELPAVEGMAQLKWLEREARRYKIPELVAACRGAHKRLDVIDVMQLLNGQKNLSGMDMRGLTVSDIDFSDASLYHAQLDGADMRRVVAVGMATRSLKMGRWSRRSSSQASLQAIQRRWPLLALVARTPRRRRALHGPGCSKITTAHGW